VGKTTTCRSHADLYLNWDNVDDREQVLAGPAKLAAALGLDRLRKSVPTLLFDELHKHARWKQFLKGFFDSYGDRARILVTGSSRNDVYRRGGDSLMGLYFHYRIHPFSIAETLHQGLPDPDRIVRKPSAIDDRELAPLWTHGGYPEPFVKRDSRFTRRLRSLRLEERGRDVALNRGSLVATASFRASCLYCVGDVLWQHTHCGPLIRRDEFVTGGFRWPTHASLPRLITSIRMSCMPSTPTGGRATTSRPV
jgi:hypothetical protein